MSEPAIGFPPSCDSVGKKVEYLSRVLVPARRFDEYVRLMGELLADGVHYIDPVHELHTKEGVLQMLAKYVPRASNDRFSFDLLVDSERQLVWRWTISLKIRFTPFQFVIHGLVHATLEGGKIVYQREYYDPMESIGVIPIFGRLYKLMLKFG